MIHQAVQAGRDLHSEAMSYPASLHGGLLLWLFLLAHGAAVVLIYFSHISIYSYTYELHIESTQYSAMHAADVEGPHTHTQIL